MFDSIKQEKEFDAAATAWIQKYRNPPQADMLEIMRRVLSYNRAVAVSSFERAYRELVAEEAIGITTEKFEQAAAQPDVLTAEAYHRIPAAEIARKYMYDRNFKASVDSLIARKLI